MIHFKVDIGRSTPRMVQVWADGIALQWKVCKSSCDGCSSAYYDILGKLEANKVDYHLFDQFVVVPKLDNPEQSIEEYLSVILDYDVKKV